MSAVLNIMRLKKQTQTTRGNMLNQQDYMAAMSYALCNQQYNTCPLQACQPQSYPPILDYTIHNNICGGLPPTPFYPQQTPISNFKYNGDKFQADVNMNTTNVLCTAAGAIAGAGLAYMLLKKMFR